MLTKLTKPEKATIARLRKAILACAELQNPARSAAISAATVAIRSLSLPPPPSQLAVVLYRFDKNLLRCIRTLASFGITELFLVESPVVERKAPYVAEDRVRVHRESAWSDVPRPILGLSLHATKRLSSVDWSEFRSVCIGGVHDNPPSAVMDEMASIDGATRPEFVTKDALAIALYSRALGVSKC